MSALQSAADAEKQADALRAALGETLDQLKDNLHPKHLANEAMATTRAHTPDWLANALGFLASPSGGGAGRHRDGGGRDGVGPTSPPRLSRAVRGDLGV